MLSFDVIFLIQDNRLYGLGLDFIQVTTKSITIKSIIITSKYFSEVTRWHDE